MTILEAILRIFETEEKTLSSKEITNRIIKNNLYSFNTPNPNSIVRLTLRRHCEGVEFASSRPNKHFYVVGTRSSTSYGLISKADSQKEKVKSEKGTIQESELLPEEKMQKIHLEHKKELCEQLLNCILNNDPSFFERLVVKLLIALGYGYGSEAGKVVGKSHDGGIDGIINQDKLGLDKIYIQAKRYSPSHNVGSKEIQAFSGAMKKVTKGVFITTSDFTKGARKEVLEQAGKQIALIDGEMLTELMLRNGVGVKCIKSFDTYEIDVDFFDKM